MNEKQQLTMRFFIRIMVGAIPLAFFGFSLFAPGQSGNNGMSLNLNKFIPVFLLFGWGGFLLIETLYHFVNNRIHYAWISLAAVLLLGSSFCLLMYVERG